MNFFQDILQIDAYISAVSWLQLFQSWGIDTEITYRTDPRAKHITSETNASLIDPHVSYGTVILTSRNEVRQLTTNLFRQEIYLRFAQDIRSAWINMWTYVVGFLLYDITLNLV